MSACTFSRGLSFKVISPVRQFSESKSAQGPCVDAAVQAVYIGLVDDGVILASNQGDSAAKSQGEVGEFPLVGEAASLVVYQHSSIDADCECGVLFTPDAFRVLVRPGEFVAARCPIG